MEIYSIKLHEQTQLDGSTWILRVAGGWIYKHYNEIPGTDGREHEVCATTFVPFNNEYQESK